MQILNHNGNGRQLFALITAKRRSYASLFMVLCLMVSLIPSHAVFAASANRLYVSPRKLQMNINTTFTADIKSYSDADQATGFAKGTVTYPSDKLQVTGISTGSSNYTFSPNPNYYINQASGSISFSGFRSPGTSGISHLFTITFKTIKAGSAVVGFTSDSTVNGAIIDNTDNTGVYTITDPTPPPATPGPSSSPRPSTSTRPSTSPSPSPVPIVTTTPDQPQSSDTPAQTVPDPAGVIDNVNVVPLYTTATITWSVNAANPSSVVRYGNSISSLDKTAPVTKKPDGTYTAQIAKLTPGLRYMFSINTTGSDGKTGTYTGSIPTRGYPVTINVTENNTQITGGQVKIGNQNSYINSSSKVTLGLATGNYTGTITTETATLNISLTVVEKPIPNDGSPPETQSFSFNLSSSVLDQGPGTSNSVLTFIGVMAVGVVVLGLGFAGFIAYRRRRFEGTDDDIYTLSNHSSVIIDDGYNWQNESQGNSVAPPPPITSNQDTRPSTNSSLNITDELPLDMYEQAARKNTQIKSQPSSTDHSFDSESEQTPSQPHSTKL